ncbi:MAG: hypothetical protein QHC67_16650 [Sphingobium sp.]|uniref:hypothetical protein n=1 Tax=Sphingobium sp. TaxID=1912891 RepID=UPI0029BE6269|nr:hypothetical protein [Sphingobium sp.]MDX3911418.1 hypothetical protein [Sphingobium sp.]
MTTTTKSSSLGDRGKDAPTVILLHEFPDTRAQAPRSNTPNFLQDEKLDEATLHRAHNSPNRSG